MDASPSASEARVVACLQGMVTGATLLKAGRSGKPHFRQFQLSPDLQSIRWESPKKNDAVVFVNDIQELIRGQSSKVFQQNPIPEHHDLSFSLVYGAGARTLDVVCKDRNEFQVWTTGITALVQKQVTPAMAEQVTKGAASTGRVQVVMDKGSTRLVVREGRSPISVGLPSSDTSDVYTWGEGKLGRLGHGEDGDEYVPRVLEALLGHDVIQLAAGGAHTIAVTDAGEVFSWGEGHAGQLGHGVQRNRYSPVAVAALRGMYVTHAAAGDAHSAAISASGHLYLWGLSQNGRLGLAGGPNRVLVPTPVASDPWDGRKVVHAACGADFTLVVIEDGRVFSSGANNVGQLGLGDTADRTEFSLVEGLLGHEIRRVACGSGHAVAVSGLAGAGFGVEATEAGQIFSWGDGSRGQLGHGDDFLKPVLAPRQIEAFRSHEVSDVSCGAVHTAVIVAPGNVYCFGEGAAGQLGYGTLVKMASVPRLVNIPENRKMVAVACGSTHTVALSEAAQMYAWGAHDNGRLGLDSTREKLIPTLLESMVGKQVKLVVCGRSHAAAMVTHGWVPDREANDCMACKKRFTQHHCRKCGGVFCNSCSSKKFPLLEAGFTEPVRVCDKCFLLLSKGS